jgi:hypothetical protein
MADKKESSYSDTTHPDVTYSYDLVGYIQTSYINITADKMDPYVNNAGYIDINANATAEATSDPQDVGDHGFNYKCHIDINGIYEIDYKVPNFLSVPGINLTLFKKMNTFSKEIANLNENLISFIQSTGCCDISYEYNKTLVPIFRYLADHPDIEGCNIMDPKVREEDTCKQEGNENFMSEILKVVREITKVYTALEPIFCIIKPIPGNPWFPVDFNWIRPILPYIEKFSKFMEKIMSGELLDVVIDPLKDLNRSLFNCRQENQAVSIDKTINSSTIIKEIKNQEVFQDSLQILTNERITNNEKLSTIEFLDKYSSKDLKKEIAKLQESKDTTKLIEFISEQSTDLKSYMKGSPSNLSTREQNKINAYYLGEKNKPLQCLRELLTLRPNLPRLPWIEISILPKSEDKKYFRNDLKQVAEERAYDIKFKDIYGEETKDFDNKNILEENIRFDRSTIYSLSFIKKFIEFMDKDGDTKNYKKLSDAVDIKTYLEDETLTAESFDVGAWDNGMDYLTNKSTLEGVLDRDFDTWNNSNNSLLDANNPGKPSVIIDTNLLIADKIIELQQEENKVINSLKEKENEDRKNWKDLRRTAISIQKTIKRKYKQQFTDAIENSTLTDWNLFDYIWAGISDYSVEQADYIISAVFLHYNEFDIINDPFDESINDHFVMSFSGNEDVKKLQETVNEYIIRRKKLLGNIAIQTFLNEYNTTTKEKEDVITNLLTINDIFVQKYLYLQALEPDIDVDLTRIYDLIIADSIYKSLSKDLNNNQYYIKNIVPILTAGAFVVPINVPHLYLHKGHDDDYDLGFNPEVSKKEFNDALDKVNSLFVINHGLQVQPSKGSADKTSEGYMLRIFKIERLKKELFITINDNVAYRFYVTFNPEITLGCNIICELIQFIVNYLLAIIKSLLKKLITWLLDYLIPDWLKNLIRLVLYKLKCFLMMAYNLSDDEDKNRLVKIDKTYDRFLEAVKNRIQLYPYDSCAKNAIEAIEENNKNDSIEDNTNIEDSGEDTNLSHSFNIYFADKDLNKIESISSNYSKDLTIVIEKDPHATLSGVVFRDYTDTNTGISATDFTNKLSSFKVTDKVDMTQEGYIVPVNISTGKIAIKNLDLSKIKTGKIFISGTSAKAGATKPEIFDSDLIYFNQVATNGAPPSTIILQDNKTESFNEFRNSSKEQLKILFDHDPQANVISITLKDKTPKIQAQTATIETPEILGSEPLPLITINIKDYEIFIDSKLGYKYFLFDCTDFFPEGYKIEGTLTTMYGTLRGATKNDILCVGDNASISNTMVTEENIEKINDNLVVSSKVTIPTIINTEGGAEPTYVENGNHQARKETPILFTCDNSNGKIFSLLEQNYKLWIDMGLIPDTNPTQEE